MKLKAVQAVSVLSAVTAMSFPATAYAGGPPNTPQPSPAPAQYGQFLNPSQNIACDIGSGSVACEIGAHNWQVSTPPPACHEHSAWGDRFELKEGGTVVIDCHNDTLRVPGLPVVANGQTQSSGAISCYPDNDSIRCTDSSTGHFFSLSTSSYQLG
jgi:hypothetical protein